MGLNHMHVRGHGAPRNAAIAAEYTQRAADLGNPEGVMALGYKCQFGVGFPKDLELAVRLHRKAIASGNPRTMNNDALLSLGDPVGPPPAFDGADRLVVHPKGMPPGVALGCGSPPVSERGDVASSSSQPSGGTCLRCRASEARGDAVRSRQV